VKTRDLDAVPAPHLDAETIFATWTPEDQRPESQKAKLAARMVLINEVINAAHIVIATPMFNWSVPSVLKAWIDQLVLPGVLDGHENAKLSGKSWTSIIATGASYHARFCN
jgi:FMN-dependent NADH-azoreductase